MKKNQIHKIIKGRNIPEDATIPLPKETREGLGWEQAIIISLYHGNMPLKIEARRS